MRKYPRRCSATSCRRATSIVVYQVSLPESFLSVYLSIPWVRRTQPSPSSPLAAASRARTPLSRRASNHGCTKQLVSEPSVPSRLDSIPSNVSQGCSRFDGDQKDYPQDRYMSWQGWQIGWQMMPFGLPPLLLFIYCLFQCSLNGFCRISASTLGSETSCFVQP